MLIPGSFPWIYPPAQPQIIYGRHVFSAEYTHTHTRLGEAQGHELSQTCCFCLLRELLELLSLSNCELRQ